jgi:hypothetical protein
MANQPNDMDELNAAVAKGIKGVARAMLKKGLDITLIAEVTCLSLEEIEQLKKLN